MKMMQPGKSSRATSMVEKERDRSEMIGNPCYTVDKNNLRLHIHGFFFENNTFRSKKNMNLRLKINGNLLDVLCWLGRTTGEVQQGSKRKFKTSIRFLIRPWWDKCFPSSRKTHTQNIILFLLYVLRS